MENIDFFTLFQGFGTMAAGGWILAAARLFLIFLGFLLVYLGWKGILEPMVMIPMGLGMIAINCNHPQSHRYSRAYGDDTDGIGDDCN